MKHEKLFFYEWTKTKDNQKFSFPLASQDE